MRYLRDRRRAQSGQTLVEVLVSLVIASLALSLIVGTLSTGLLDATLAKRNTAVQAVMQYEMEQVSASTFNASYSDCFATETSLAPTPASQGSCPSGYTFRADVSCGQTCSSTLQTWTITISAWPSGASTGKSISIYKAVR